MSTQEMPELETLSNEPLDGENDFDESQIEEGVTGSGEASSSVRAEFRRSQDASDPIPDIGVYSDLLPGDPAETRSAFLIPEVVIGPDDRRPVTDPLAYPWRAIASLVITTSGGRVGVGTGWFVSPRTLVTAGHCVYIHSRDPTLAGWVRRIDVIPARTRHIQPFGAASTNRYDSVAGWTRDGNRAFDYAALHLPSATPLGSTVGTMNFGSLSDADFENWAGSVVVSGYPDDKHGEQWFDEQEVVDVTSSSISYLTDTEGGQSGAPVWARRQDGTPVVAGIHAYGGSTSNYGTRISPSVFNWIRSHRK